MGMRAQPSHPNDYAMTLSHLELARKHVAMGENYGASQQAL
jgi:hypothetical protein